MQWYSSLLAPDSRVPAAAPAPADAPPPTQVTHQAPPPVAAPVRASAPVANAASALPPVGNWHSAGPPPSSRPLSLTHSWFYVPLLLAGARHLQPNAEEAWRQDPRFSGFWPQCVQQLRQGGMVPWVVLFRVLSGLQGVAAARSHSEAAALQRIALAGAALPAGSAVSFQWALEHLLSPDGYLVAPAQEALLQVFLGDRLAAQLAQHVASLHSGLPVAAVLPLPTSGRDAPLPAPAPGSLPAAPPPVPCSDTTRQPPPVPPAPRRRPDPAAAVAPPAVGPAAPAGRGRPEAPQPERAPWLSSPSQAVGLAAPAGRDCPEAPPPEHAPRANSPSPELGDAVQATEPPFDLPLVPPGDRISLSDSRARSALSSLDPVDLLALLRIRVALFPVPPAFARGQVRQALSLALQAILDAAPLEDDNISATRAWKLWLLLPRMLLHRRPGQRKLPKSEWRARLLAFQRGDWLQLLRNVTESLPDQEVGPAAHAASPPSPESLAAADSRRARHLVHLGELSAARRTLCSSPLAPGNADTLAELRDPARRPPQAYEPIAPELLAFQPDQHVLLRPAALLSNLQRARKAAAPGPSGHTAELIRLVLDDEADSDRFVRVAQQLAKAAVPPVVARALGLGRIVALTKPSGRVRGIVVSDFLRRLVARTLAQQFASSFHDACSPHQFALSTRSGVDAVVHALAASVELDPTASVLSVDGVGAFDTISRNAMLTGLHSVPGANACLPFVRLFYSCPSEFVWHDESGDPHTILQAEGGEQGDPLMPALYALGQRPALAEVQHALQPGERLLAFHDDIYAVVPQPERVRSVFDSLSEALWRRARIRLNQGKTKVWNASGSAPQGILDLDPGDFSVWVGALSLPAASRGLTVLGVPLGSSEFVAAQLQVLANSHASLLQRVQSLEDLQASWLLLLFCCSPRCNHVLRLLPPDCTSAFATTHDAALVCALSDLLQAGPLPAPARQLAQTPLRLGGLGLRSAVATAPAAYWASWADTLQVFRRQLPALLELVLPHLGDGGVAGSAGAPCLQAASAVAVSLAFPTWQPPSWQDLAAGAPSPAFPAEPEEAPDLATGWQRQATAAVEDAAFAALHSSLDPSSQALLFSQQGPFASRVFTLLPVSVETTLPCHAFRSLLLRRLRLPLPVSDRFCRCHRRLDPLGDHRAACARAGVLRSRGCPLERAAARVCREAGARVSVNTRLADLNLVVDQVDDRRLEVVANGLPLWNGVQLAVDTTLVSPLTACGEPRRRAGRFQGAALAEARLRKERTYPELLRSHRCRLVVLALELGGRWSPEAADFLRLLARARARSAPPRLRAAVVAASVARWSSLLACAAHGAFAESLCFQNVSANACNLDGPFIPFSELLSDSALPPPVASRLPR